MQQSAREQKKQAHLALQAARIELQSIRLSSVTATLAHLRSRQSQLVNLQSQHGPSGTYFDERSNRIQISLALEQINQAIQESSSEEKDILEEIQKIGKRFPRTSTVGEIMMGMV